MEYTEHDYEMMAQFFGFGSITEDWSKKKKDTFVAMHKYREGWIDEDDFIKRVEKALKQKG